MMSIKSLRAKIIVQNPKKENAYIKIHHQHINK